MGGVHIHSDLRVLKIKIQLRFTFLKPPKFFFCLMKPRVTMKF